MNKHWMKRAGGVLLAGAIVVAMGGCSSNAPYNSGNYNAPQGQAQGSANDLDGQASRLREGVQGSGADVIRTSTTVQLSMPGALLFANDSSELSAQVKPVLTRVANTLADFPDTNILVDGYTDSTGSASYNRNLSLLRAQSVANALTQNGIPYGRLHIVGHGESNPVASNSTAAGREKNRRVTITLVPPKYTQQVIQGQMTPEQVVPGQQP